MHVIEDALGLQDGRIKFSFLQLEYTPDRYITICQQNGINYSEHQAQGYPHLQVAHGRAVYKILKSPVQEIPCNRRRDYKGFSDPRDLHLHLFWQRGPSGYNPPD